MLTRIQSPIRVIVADPCPVMHTGLIETIESDAYLQVVATAAHHLELLPHLATIPAHILVIDLIELGDAPVPLLREVKQAYPRLDVVVFSDSVDFAPELRAAGASGYVAKREPAEQLHLAIRAALSGQTFVSPLVQDYVQRRALSTSQDRLSDQELLALRYVAQGLSNQEIQCRMAVKLHTVENYVTTIRKKIGIENRVQMGAWYRRLYGSVSSVTEPVHFYPHSAHDRRRVM